MDIGREASMRAIHQPLERRVFTTKLSLEFELEPSECFEQLRPLYGLCDACQLWNESLHQHFSGDQRMVSTKTDPSLFFSFRDNKLSGAHGSNVNDLLRTRDRDVKVLCSKAHNRFETNGNELLPVTFAGFNIRKEQNFLTRKTNFLRETIAGVVCCLIHL